MAHFVEPLFPGWLPAAQRYRQRRRPTQRPFESTAPKTDVPDAPLPGAGELAAKVVDKQNVTATFLGKFLPREIAIWAPLQHPNLVRMYGRFETDPYSFSFLLLELATGRDLLTRVQQDGAANEATARDWLRQLVAGVAHLLDVAHRDLKLENVLVGANGRLKITDLGLSREVGDELATTFCGSKEYLAPEMLAGQPYDALKADVWALGVIGFVIVTNHMPFADRGGVNAIIDNQRARAYRYRSRVASAPTARSSSTP